jgi:hypothetical protein
MDTVKYQLRLYLQDDLAEAARRGGSPELAPLMELLARHQAEMKSQYDAFAEYVAEAERKGPEGYPLYRWTKATIEDPAKKAKYLKVFTIYAQGQEVYDKVVADALEAGLRPLVESGLVAQVTRHDTNPANNPQPPASLA